MTHYAIIGGGRLARHMTHYLSLLEIPHSNWARDLNCTINTHTELDSKRRLRLTVTNASHVLLAVSDSAITSVLNQHPWQQEKTWVHCSGAFSFPGIAGAHPLMTFGPDLYTLEQYQAIPFVVESGYDFARLLPGLPNPHHFISSEDKALYHALCVMAGNFSQMLWRATASRFSEMGLPHSVLELYLQQNVSNFIIDPQSAMTGPLSRGDQQTVERHLAALDGDQLKQIYQSFVELHQSQQHLEWPREAAV